MIEFYIKDSFFFFFLAFQTLENNYQRYNINQTFFLLLFEALETLKVSSGFYSSVPVNTMRPCAETMSPTY